MDQIWRGFPRSRNATFVALLDGCPFPTSTSPESKTPTGKTQLHNSNTIRWKSLPFLVSPGPYCARIWGLGDAPPIPPPPLGAPPSPGAPGTPPPSGDQAAPPLPPPGGTTDAAAMDASVCAACKRTTCKYGLVSCERRPGFLFSGCSNVCIGRVKATKCGKLLRSGKAH